MYLQREQYKEAIAVLEQLIAPRPEKKTYWMQLSSIYGQIEDYPNALAIMQIAYNAGLVTEDSELRRLADLLLFNSVPYRGAQVLETAIEKKTVKLDEKLYEKLANCWIAAGEFDKAINPLQKSRGARADGRHVRAVGRASGSARGLGRVHHRAAKRHGEGPAQRRGQRPADVGRRVLQPEELQGDARTFFERAAQSVKHKQIATSYLQAIKALT